MRGENALESALARAENKTSYGDPDIAELAGAYMFGLVRNHAFVDGNKRTALAAALTCLVINGYVPTADPGTLYTFVMNVAAREIDETGAAAFFRDYIEQV